MVQFRYFDPYVVRVHVRLRESCTLSCSGRYPDWSAQQAQLVPQLIINYKLKVCFVALLALARGADWAAERGAHAHESDDL